MYEAAVEDYNLAVYNHETYGNPITVPRPEDREISLDDLTSDRWGICADLSWGLNGIFKKDFETIEQTMYPIYGSIGISYQLK